MNAKIKVGMVSLPITATLSLKLENVELEVENVDAKDLIAAMKPEKPQGKPQILSGLDLLTQIMEGGGPISVKMPYSMSDNISLFKNKTKNPPSEEE